MKLKIFKNQYTFKPSLIPLIAFIVALSILIGLSSWQFKRLAWKKNLIEARVSMFESDPKPLNDLKNPSEMEFQRISVRGKLFNEFEFFMPALSKNGNNG